MPNLPTDQADNNVWGPMLNAAIESLHQTGTHAARPTTGLVTGTLYSCTDHRVLERWNGTTWAPVAGGGTYRGAWVSSPLLVVWSDEFADGTKAPFTSSYTGGGSDPAIVQGYTSINGGDIPSPPVNMFKLGKTDYNGNTTTLSLDLNALSLPTVSQVRYWWAQSSTGGTLSFLRAGTPVGAVVSNIGWTQRTDSVAPTETIGWRNYISADPYPSSYVTRVELLAPDPDVVPYRVNDLVTHQGALYRNTSENTSETPGAGSAWTPVEMGATDPWHVVGAAGEPAFQNGWVNYGGAYATCTFRKLPSGLVVVKGFIKKATAGSTITSQTVFQLPVGYRPAQNFVLITNCEPSPGTGVGRLDVAATGEVIVQNGTSGWTSLGNLTFMAEQ